MMGGQSSFLAVLFIVGLASDCFSDTSKTDPTTNKAKNSGAAGSTAGQGGLIIPVRVHPCIVQEVSQFPTKIEAREKSELRVLWSALIEKIHVNIGDTVRKGQVIASVDTSDYQKQIQIYDDYMALFSGQIDVANQDVKSLTRRRVNIAGLVAKGIVPSTDLEKVDTEVLGAKNFKIQMERMRDGMLKTLSELHKMEKNASFYSEIDGVVTALMADPGSIVGKLSAMSGALIARIEKPGQYIAQGNLLDIQLKALEVGQIVDVELPDHSHYEGKVKSISPVRIEQKNDGQSAAPSPSSEPSQYQVVIEFTRPGEMLPAELTATATVKIAQPRSKACLPWNAIDVSAQGATKIRGFSEGKGWQTQFVTLGKRGQYEVEILSPELPSSMTIESRLW